MGYKIQKELTEVLMENGFPEITELTPKTLRMQSEKYGTTHTPLTSVLTSLGLEDGLRSKGVVLDQGLIEYMVKNSDLSQNAQKARLPLEIVVNSINKKHTKLISPETFDFMVKNTDLNKIYVTGVFYECKTYGVEPDQSLFNYLMKKNKYFLEEHGLFGTVASMINDGRCKNFSRELFGLLAKKCSFDSFYFDYIIKAGIKLKMDEGFFTNVLNSIDKHKVDVEVKKYIIEDVVKAIQDNGVDFGKKNLIKLINHYEAPDKRSQYISDLIDKFGLEENYIKRVNDVTKVLSTIRGMRDAIINCNREPRDSYKL